MHKIGYQIAIAFVVVMIVAGCSAKNDLSNPTKNPGTATTSPSPGNPGNSEATDNPNDKGPDVTGSPKEAVVDLAKEVIALIEDKNFAELSLFVHPEKGVRFSPYGHIQVDTDRVYNADRLKTAMKDTVKYQWGFYDGSGEAIELTFSEYYNKFIYDKNFATPEKIGYDEVFGAGNIYNNIKEVYPNANIVDYHFSGFNKAVEGMDWQSLRLLFEEKDGALYIVAIIHDQWTI